MVAPGGDDCRHEVDDAGNDGADDKNNGVVHALSFFLFEIRLILANNEVQVHVRTLLWLITLTVFLVILQFVSGTRVPVVSPPPFENNAARPQNWPESKEGENWASPDFLRRTGRALWTVELTVTEC